MAATATAQINARIDADLKARGDAGLAAAGYTPTQAVRALWAYAAKWANEPEKIEAALADEPSETELERRERRRRAVEEGPQLIYKCYAQLGLEPPSGPCPLTDEELKEQAYRERGLLL